MLFPHYHKKLFFRIDEWKKDTRLLTALLHRHIVEGPYRRWKYQALQIVRIDWVWACHYTGKLSYLF